MEFIKKLFVCVGDVTQPDDIITYGSLVQGAMYEYQKNVESKLWEPTDSKNISKDVPLLLKDSTVAIEATVNKTVEKVYYEIRHKGKYNKSGVGSSTKSVVTCYKCDKNGH